MATIYDKLISQEGLFPNIGGAYLNAKDTSTDRFLKRINQFADTKRQDQYLDIQQQYANAEREMRPTKEALAKTELEMSKMKLENITKELNPEKYPEYHQRKSFNEIITRLYSSGDSDEKAVATKWMRKMNEKKVLTNDDYVELESDFSNIQKDKINKSDEILLRQSASIPTRDFRDMIENSTIPEKQRNLLISRNKSAVSAQRLKLMEKRQQLEDLKKFIDAAPEGTVSPMFMSKGKPEEQIKQIDATIEYLDSIWSEKGADSTKKTTSTNKKLPVDYKLPEKGTVLTDEEANNIYNFLIENKKYSKQDARNYLKENYK